MESLTKSLKYFPRDNNGLFTVYELFTFDNLFRLLLNEGHSHNDTLDFMIASCSFNALVFQERIHNNKYKDLRKEDLLYPEDSFIKANLIKAIIDF